MANTDYRGNKDPVTPISFEQFMLERAGTAGLRPRASSVPNPGVTTPSVEWRMRQQEQMGQFLRGTNGGGEARR